MDMTSNTISSTNTTTTNTLSSLKYNNSCGNNSHNSSSAGASASTSTTTTNTIVHSCKCINPNVLFCQQANAVSNFFERWNDCERTVVLYSMMKRLRYPNLKFLQFCVDSNLSQTFGTNPDLSSVLIDFNANNASYLQNLLNAYHNTVPQTTSTTDTADTVSTSSSDKDSVPSFGVEFTASQLANEECNKLIHVKKEEILLEVLSMVPLLKPGNEEAKQIYMTLLPIAVLDTTRNVVSTDLVQQIFSYLLIHPAITIDDRRSLGIWLRHLEEHIKSTEFCTCLDSKHLGSQKESTSISCLTIGRNVSQNPINSSVGASASIFSPAITTSVSNATSASSSATNTPKTCTRSADWQTIAPPNKQNQQLQQQQLLQQSGMTTVHDWSSLLTAAKTNQVNGTSGGRGSVGSVGGITDQLCDNLNGITLNELASSQNSLGLTSIGANLGNLDMDMVDSHNESSSIVNGVVAAAVAATGSSTANTLFGDNSNSILNFINTDNSATNNAGEDLDTSFSKNGTVVLDFEPNQASNTTCDVCHNNLNDSCHKKFCETTTNILQPPFPFGTMFTNTFDQFDTHRWSLDSKLAALKTRRSNSLTTQTISTSSTSSSNSSVITVNDNLSSSSENLAQFANKPRSFSLSIEHQRNGLTNCGSDTRLDEFKPSYIRFQTRNVGMSNIGLWLKSLRLHKYIDLFKNMTYEDMLEITEDYLQSLGVTKGASHKLALCIEKVKERFNILTKMEKDLLAGQMSVQSAIEELANMVLTPMKPVESVSVNMHEDNVALQFLKMLDLVCSMVSNDTYGIQDDENFSVLIWVLDRSLHSESFINHINQLKEMKFKISKIRMAIAPKMHHGKTGSNGNLNKPRWTGKGRKGDSKNGSNDRINYRKNSNDMLNFSMNCLQPHQGNNNNNANNNGTNNTNKQLQQQMNEFEKYNQMIKQQQQQQQYQQQQQLGHQHQQHRRSLNNLIVVSGGPQKAQKMIFKPGHGMIPAATSSTDNLQMQLQQQRKASLPFTPTVTKATNADSNQQQQQQQQMQLQQLQQTQSQQPKKSMAAVVMENFKFADHFSLF